MRAQEEKGKEGERKGGGRCGRKRNDIRRETKKWRRRRTKEITGRGNDSEGQGVTREGKEV